MNQKKRNGAECIMTDRQVVEAIRKIVGRGNNAEVKRRRDGSLVVYEVKKEIIGGKHGAN